MYFTDKQGNFFVDCESYSGNGYTFYRLNVLHESDYINPRTGVLLAPVITSRKREGFKPVHESQVPFEYKRVAELNLAELDNLAAKENTKALISAGLWRMFGPVKAEREITRRLAAQDEQWDAIHLD